MKKKQKTKQDCIPVGCMPTAGWLYLGSGGGGVSLDADSPPRRHTTPQRAYPPEGRPPQKANPLRRQSPTVDRQMPVKTSPLRYAMRSVINGLAAFPQLSSISTTIALESLCTLDSRTSRDQYQLSCIKDVLFPLA